MKIRAGFVSNSSSSSFMCNVCGSMESGMDASLSDFDMTGCVNGHEFCNDHAKDLPKPTKTTAEKKAEMLEYYSDRTYYAEERNEILEAETDEDIDDLYSDFVDNHYDEVDESQCPVCSFVAVDTEDVAKYFMKKNNLTRVDVAKLFKDEFGTYGKLQEFIK